MNGKTILIMTWAALAATGTLRAEDVDEDADWRQVRDRADLKVWMRRVPDSNVRELRAETLIDAPVDAIWATLDDIEHHHEFMPFVVESRVIERSSQHVLMYQRIDPPFVNHRDYGLRIRTERDEDAGVFRRRFVVANDHAPALPLDRVRVVVVQGYWELRPRARGRTAVRYALHTDPGGRVPKWVINLGAKRSVARLFEAVRTRAEDPQWQRTGPLLAAEEGTDGS
jgi:ribosome-associated toxin RatA of RatAB toxin-antitoxin module